MSFLFGAQSDCPVTQRLINGYNLFDWIMRKNCFPAFWGRNILGATPISEHEITFLHNNNCKIMPIINDLKEIWVGSDDPDEGTEDALRAVEAAIKLSIPHNCDITLFAHIHSTWEPTYGWLTGYAKTIADNGYVPGFIFGINNPIFYPDSNFIKKVKKQRCHIVSCTDSPPIQGELASWCDNTEKSNPENILLLRTGTTKLGNVEAHHIYAKNSSVLNHMW